MAESAETLAFPHYKPEEREVAKRFLASKKLEGAWTFWVVLDTPQSRNLALKGADSREIWLWQKQIDALCETESDIWIVEFKEKIRPSAIGQLEVYMDLYRSMYNPVKSLKKILVATIDDPSIHPTLKRHKIRWELV